MILPVRVFVSLHQTQRIEQRLGGTGLGIFSNLVPREAGSHEIKSRRPVASCGNVADFRKTSDLDKSVSPSIDFNSLSRLEVSYSVVTE